MTAAGTARVMRLLSPTGRRICYLDRANPRHAATLGQLASFGWHVYTGPARTDQHGWVLPGTDPHLQTPTPTDPREIDA